MTAEWTFLVYMAANNSLSGHVDDSISDMESVTTNDMVNVIVQVRTPTLPTTRYQIHDNQAEALPWPSNSPVDPDMAEQQTLTDFMNWSLTNYPAKRVALIAWCHGGGLEDTPPSPPIDDLLKKTPKKIPKDDPDNDALFYNGDDDGDVDGASSMTVAQFRAAIPTSIDLIGLDACLMGMVEVAYEMRLVASTMVASENLAPAQGWPYGSILTSLFATPTMGPEALAQTIVSAFQTWYSDPNHQSHDESKDGNDVGYAAQAAIRLKAASDTPAGALTIDDLATSIGALGTALAGAVPTAASDISAARTDGIAMNIPDYVDLQAFLSEMSSQGIAVSTDDVQSKLDGVMVAPPCQVGAGATNANGLSIFFPTDPSLLAKNYAPLAFGTNPWRTFVATFLASPAGIGLLPSIAPNKHHLPINALAKRARKRS